MHRPGVELALFRSLMRLPITLYYRANPDSDINAAVNSRLTWGPRMRIFPAQKLSTLAYGFMRIIANLQIAVASCSISRSSLDAARFFITASITCISQYHVQQLHFYPAVHYTAKCGLGIACMSSVSLSVTLVDYQYDYLNTI